MNETERMVNDAVMGDSDAIQQIAARLDFSPVQVADALDERWAFKRAAAKFKDEYADIVGDPHLWKLAQDRDSELAGANPTMDYGTRLKLVGEGLRDWLKKLGAGKPTATKQVNKPPARDPAARRPAVSTTWDTSDEVGNEPEDVQEVIQQMAQARGQARAIVHRHGPHLREHD